MFLKKLSIISVSCYTVVASLLLTLFLQKDSFFIAFINHTFIISLLMVIFGGFLFVIEKGVFNVFIYSSIRFGKMFNRKKEALIDDEMSNSDNKDILYRQWDFVITNPVFFSGLLLSVLMIIISFVFLV